MGGRRISKQRSFSVPREHLNLFLKKCEYIGNKDGYIECEYIFDEGPKYFQCVCNAYGLVADSAINDLEIFVRQLQGQK